MAKSLISILLLFGFYSFGQVARIEVLKVLPSKKIKGIQSDKMNYPVIRTGSDQIDSLINFEIMKKFTDNESSEKTIQKALNKWAAEGIIFLDFQITYNKNGIISLNISAEGCGAYCTGWTEYFNYSILTGKSLDIKMVVDTEGDFKDLVIKHKKAQYDNQRKELKEMLNDKNSELDVSTYEQALEYYTECENSFKFENFALYPDHLEIIETCYLPHVMQNLTPVIDLKYKYSNIKEYLKMKN